MKKRVINLPVRIITTIIIAFLIFVFANIVLEIKYRKKNNSNSIGWTWKEENEIILKLLDEKYSESNDQKTFLMTKNGESIPKKENGEKRILVVGDSFIYGYGGTNVNYTWWKQLNLIIKENGYNNVNVYGAGKPGLSTEEELNRILKNDELIEMIDPDLVIIGYVTNDPDRREPNGETMLKEEWEISEKDHPLYKKNKNLYYELVDRMNSLDETETDKLIELGNLLGFYRWDIRRLMLLQGENLEYYKNILKSVDDRMKGLDIPYFFIQTDPTTSKFVDQANEILYKLMDELSIKIYKGLKAKEVIDTVEPGNYQLLNINPADAHPNIIWTSNLAKYALEIINNHYNFIFENKLYQDINELELNVNDTMPFLDVKKVKNNVYEFEYPEEEEKRTVESKLLYLPIEKEYVKLNLEFPKNVKKIIITGDNLKSTEVYVNIIDEEYGYDLDSVYQKLTSCKHLGNDTYQVNKKITSVNIVVSFKNNSDRKIRVEFIEE